MSSNMLHPIYELARDGLKIIFEIERLSGQPLREIDCTIEPRFWKALDFRAVQSILAINRELKAHLVLLQTEVQP